MSPFMGGGRDGRSGGRTVLRPEQKLNNAEADQEKVNKILAKEDARYDAMTDEEREKYYVKPSAFTKFKKFFLGRD
jgi:hypothetical protein